MSPQITAHSRRSGNVFPLCLGSALRLLGILPSPSTSTRKRTTSRSECAFCLSTLCGVRFLVRPRVKAQAGYSVRLPMQASALGCLPGAARSFVAGGLAAPCIRGCGPDRRGLAGCAALPIESLVATMLVLLDSATCSGRGGMRWPGKENRRSVFCAAMTESYRIRCGNATGFGRDGQNFFAPGLRRTKNRREGVC